MKESISGNGWRSWTPTWTLTNSYNQLGDKTGAYVVIGKTCFFWASLKVNASSNWGGMTAITLTLPVTASAQVAAGYQPLNCIFLDDGYAWYQGGSVILTTTTASAWCLKVDGTYGYFVGANGNGAIPFGWSLNDMVKVSGTYEID